MTELLAANNAKKKKERNKTICQIRSFKSTVRFMAIKYVSRSQRTRETKRK